MWNFNLIWCRGKYLREDNTEKNTPFLGIAQITPAQLPSMQLVYLGKWGKSDHFHDWYKISISFLYRILDKQLSSYSSAQLLNDRQGHDDYLENLEHKIHSIFLVELTRHSLHRILHRFDHHHRNNDNCNCRSKSIQSQIMGWRRRRQPLKSSESSLIPFDTFTFDT